MNAAVSLLTSALLHRRDGITHGFTRRFVSQAPNSPTTAPKTSSPTSDVDAELHLSLAAPALVSARRVLSNRRQVLHALGRPDARWVSVQQVHGNRVVEVTARSHPQMEADGLWTRDRHAVLAVLAADCVPILICDADAQVVAAVHAGWRGTQSKVVVRMVESLDTLAHRPPSALFVALGPAIGPCCFGISLDTAQLLAPIFPGTPEAVMQQDTDLWKADLWALNIHLLCQAGVPAANIDVLRLCTFCTPGLFSHRRDRERAGRHAGVIALC